MATPVVQEDCVGITLRLTVTAGDGVTPVPLTGSPACVLRLRDPVSGDVVERAATVTGDGTAGEMEYLTSDEDLTTPGTWKYQGKATWSADQILYTSVKKIKVKANL